MNDRERQTEISREIMDQILVRLKAQHHGAGCWLCGLDPELRTGIEMAWSRGARGTAIQGWLRSIGYEVGAYKIRHHFAEHHHERAT